MTSLVLNNWALIFFFFLHENMLWVLPEAPQDGASNEYPQNKFSEAFLNIWCTIQEKGPYAIYRQGKPWSTWAFMQADQGFHCPLTGSMDTLVYVEEQGLLRSGFMDAHAYLDLLCSHIA